MKKILALVLALIMVLSLVACGTEKPVETQAPAAGNETPGETQAPAEKKPEDYTGNLVIYSPHDPSPLEAGVEMFRQAYPNINVEIVNAGTGELT